MFNISKNKCIGCELCRQVCPKQIALNLKTGISEIKKQDQECLKKAAQACPQKAIKNLTKDLVFAIGTDDKETIKFDDHVGMAKYFQVWQFSHKNLSMKLIENRENTKYSEDETRIHGDPKKAQATASALRGIDVLVGRMMGPNIERLKHKFVPIIIRERNIQESIKIIQENINEIFEEKEKDSAMRHGIILK
jgi:ferredoxin